MCECYCVQHEPMIEKSIPQKLTIRYLKMSEITLYIMYNFVWSVVEEFHVRNISNNMSFPLNSYES